jgi:hypothetical protein
MRIHITIARRRAACLTAEAPKWGGIAKAAPVQMD